MGGWRVEPTGQTLQKDIICKLHECITLSLSLPPPPFFFTNSQYKRLQSMRQTTTTTTTATTKCAYSFQYRVCFFCFFLGGGGGMKSSGKIEIIKEKGLKGGFELWEKNCRFRCQEEGCFRQGEPEQLQNDQNPQMPSLVVRTLNLTLSNLVTPRKGHHPVLLASIHRNSTLLTVSGLSRPVFSYLPAYVTVCMSSVYNFVSYT